MKKLAIAGEYIFLLLTELSFAQCLVLGVIVSTLVYIILSGGAMMASALPLWAMASGTGGLAVVLLGTVRMGQTKLGLSGVLLVGLFMIQLGSANVLTPDAAERVQIGQGHWPSLNDMTQVIAWGLAVGSMVAGIAVGTSYVIWSRQRRVKRTGIAA